MVVAIPILSGSLLRVPLGLLSDRFGGKKVGTIMLICLYGAADARLAVGRQPRATCWPSARCWASPARRFAVALPLASRWYPPEYQGLAMGIAGAGNSGTVLANAVRAAPRRRSSAGRRVGAGDDPAADRARRLRRCWRRRARPPRARADWRSTSRVLQRARHCGRSACSTRSPSAATSAWPASCRCFFRDQYQRDAGHRRAAHRAGRRRRQPVCARPAASSPIGSAARALLSMLLGVIAVAYAACSRCRRCRSSSPCCGR